GVRKAWRGGPAFPGRKSWDLRLSKGGPGGGAGGGTLGPPAFERGRVWLVETPPRLGAARGGPLGSTGTPPRPAGPAGGARPGPGAGAQPAPARGARLRSPGPWPSAAYCLDARSRAHEPGVDG